jgi:phage tail sheath gpL-like
MTVSPPSGFDPNNPLPFIGLAVRLGVGARAVAAPRVMMLLGNIVENAITATVGSDDYVTAAGTASLATPIQVASADDADTYFGVGSELALMCRAVFAQKRGAYVWACPVAQHGSAVKATAVMLFATTATSAGSVKVTIAGRTCIEAAVASGDTASTIATAVAHAINKTPNLPVTATVSSATVTLTAKCGGTRGNAIREDGVQQAKGDVEALRAVIVRANNALFSVGPDIQDAEHMIECHADTATEAYRRLAVGANEAWGVLTAAVADMIEPKESA